MNTKKIFSNPLLSVLFALVTCALWGSLFPFVKIGYSAFHIDSSDIPSIILFAGIRFAVSGLIMIAFFSVTEKKLLFPTRRDVLPVGLAALTGIVLHYAFTYLALSVGEGSKSAIIKQVGFLFLSCFSFVFIKDDKFSLKKLVCGCLGFFGIIVTNMDGGAFTFGAGDALLIVASLCSVVSTVVTKKAVEKTSPLTLVAYSQLSGGVLMCICGMLLGGKIQHFDMRSLAVFSYICIASIVAYSLWNVLIKYNSIAKLSLIKFTEPLFAVVLSGLFLRENILKINYLLALIIIFAAILMDNLHFENKKRKDSANT